MLRLPLWPLSVIILAIPFAHSHAINLLHLQETNSSALGNNPAIHCVAAEHIWGHLPRPEQPCESALMVLKRSLKWDAKKTSRTFYDSLASSYEELKKSDMTTPIRANQYDCTAAIVFLSNIPQVFIPEAHPSSTGASAVVYGDRMDEAFEYMKTCLKYPQMGTGWVNIQARVIHSDIAILTFHTGSPMDMVIPPGRTVSSNDVIANLTYA